MSNMNVVVISGNLTKDPELRQLPSGTSVCKLRIAVNDRYKDRDGNWGERPFYFDVTVFGRSGENIAQHLGKGSGLVIQGKLEWREWESQDGTKRQAVDILARDVQWLPKADGTRSSPSGGNAPAPAPAPAGAQDDDDIPFNYQDFFSPETSV